MKELKAESFRQNEEALKRLILCHDKAVKEKKQIFDFDGIVCQTSYTKYLIEFLTSELRHSVVIDDGDYSEEDEKMDAQDDDDSGVEID